MPHCDPAPPHPDPGAVYNAVCLPSLEDVAILVGLLVVITGTIWLSARRDVGTVGGEADE